MMDEKEFRSKVEDLVDNVKELRYPSSAGFKPFHHFFCEEAVSHPAKANLYVLHYLIKKYTKEDEVVADILAGSGSTGIIASYLGRHSILVELEGKFVEWINKNVGILEKRGRKKGEIKVIQGDARKLADLLGVKANSIITSPPYVESKAFHDVEFMKKIAGDQSEKVRHGEVRGHYMTEEARKRVFERMERGKTDNPSNIGSLPSGNIDAIAKLPHGDVDTIITSPPYSQSAQDSDKSPCVTKPPRKGDVRQSGRKPPINKYSDSPDNIGNLPHGEVDAIITSPPYADAKKGEADEEAMAKRWDKAFKETGETWNS